MLRVPRQRLERPSTNQRRLVAIVPSVGGSTASATSLAPGFVLGFGYLGVPLFFVISGFCIHLPQARLLAARGPAGASPAWRRFFAGRFWRLYPPYLAAIALAFLLLALAQGRRPVPWQTVA